MEKRKQGNLLFLTLIMELYILSGVKMEETDQMIKDKGVINEVVIEMLKAVVTTKEEGILSSPSSRSPPTKPTC